MIGLGSEKKGYDCPIAHLPQFLGEKRINGSFWEIHVISCFPTADIPFLSSEDKWHCFSLTGWILKCTPVKGMLKGPDMRAAPANTHSRVSSPLKCALVHKCAVWKAGCVCGPSASCATPRMQTTSAPIPGGNYGTFLQQ